MKTKITCSTLNLYIFSDIKENSLGGEYQNILIFISLLIADDEGWTTDLWQVSPNLLAATKLGNGAHRLGGNQALKISRRYCSFVSLQRQKIKIMVVDGSILVK